MKAWIVAVVVAIAMACAGPAWALAGQQWQCTASGDSACSYGHPITIQWNDGGAGGTFSDAAAWTTTYTPPANFSGLDMTVTLTVTGTCTADPLIHGSSGVPVVVFTESHSITIEATAVPLVVAMGESSQLRAE
ncbi:MAG TPA: Ig-like domain-containing protein, partial [Anaerolineae bacterium]|nr:Ig-like domain-containing protein [Anaerolineae bacterium]